MEVSCQLHALAALHPGKEPLLPTGPHSWSGHGDEKNSQHLPGLGPSIIQFVAQRYNTVLSWLRNSLVHEDMGGQCVMQEIPAEHVLSSVEWTKQTS
jgi:hypothetical protein